MRPIEGEGQRAAGFCFGDKRVQALFTVLALFCLYLRGFTNQEIRPLPARLLGLDPANYPIGRMTYDLRRLRLDGIIERTPHSHRYQAYRNDRHMLPRGRRGCLNLTHSNHNS
ncbi:MAG: hypothetical protein ABI822_23200 [Bryobacteraceae bacterium]